MSIEYTKDRVEKFSEIEIESFKAIVLEKDQVRKETFDQLISKNPILLFIPNTAEIQAIGALKIPADDYKQNVFIKSKTNEMPNDFSFELGWIVSQVEGQGLGTKLVELLMCTTPNVYATVRTDNKKMIHILKKFGFIKTGESYMSDRGDYNIELYIKKV